MSIEHDALRVADFLRSLQEKIITDPEFGRLYGDMGRMDQNITDLATALTFNFQRLGEARRNVSRYPTRRQYQDDVDGYLQGLSANSLEVKRLWDQFRADTLHSTESLILRVEEEVTRQLAPPASSSDADAAPAPDTQADSPPARLGWLQTTLSGLTSFKDFLSVAVDVDKAVTQWSPALMEGVKNAFDLLGQLHF